MDKLYFRANKGLTEIFPQPEEFAGPLQKNWTDLGVSLCLI